jgi:hypothetical protein
MLGIFKLLSNKDPLLFGSGTLYPFNTNSRDFLSESM